MSVLGLQPTAPHDTDLPDCFLCGAPLTDPSLYRAGHLDILLLHPACAVRLAGGLLLDLVDLHAREDGSR